LRRETFHQQQQQQQQDRHKNVKHDENRFLLESRFIDEKLLVNFNSGKAGRATRTNVYLFIPDERRRLTSQVAHISHQPRLVGGNEKFIFERNECS